MFVRNINNTVLSIGKNIMNHIKTNKSKILESEKKKNIVNENDNISDNISNIKNIDVLRCFGSHKNSVKNALTNGANPWITEQNKTVLIAELDLKKPIDIKYFKIKNVSEKYLTIKCKNIKIYGKINNKYLLLVSSELDKNINDYHSLDNNYTGKDKIQYIKLQLNGSIIGCAINHFNVYGIV